MVQEPTLEEHQLQHDEIRVFHHHTLFGNICRVGKTVIIDEPYRFEFKEQALMSHAVKCYVYYLKAVEECLFFGGEIIIYFCTV